MSEIKKYRKIKLTKEVYTLVDNDDFLELSKFKWIAHGNSKKGFRAIVTNKIGEKWVQTSLSDFLMKPSKGMIVDHINHNSLDNRRCNLRICTVRQNSFNRIAQHNLSGYKGVYHKKNMKKWCVRIFYNYKEIHLGSFENIKDAARAYNQKAQELFGEFACLNKL
jgi:hypothetical protein